MLFNYQARTRTGEIQTGTVEASSKETAFDILKSRGLYVTALEEARARVYAMQLRIFQPITKRDIVIFSRELAIMLKSKVPLVESFLTIAKQTNNPNFKEKIMKIAQDIEGGSSLSKALNVYPKLFTPFYINMVKSGEASGKLTDVFVYLADYLERENNFRGKIKGAMVYPAFILFVFGAVLAIMILYVIPKLSEVLKETGQELPWITRFVLASSDFARTKGWLIILVLILVLAIIYRLTKTAKGKDFLDRTLLRIPALGGFLKKLYLTRFALNLSTLISGGLPIAQSLEITAAVVGNNVYKEIILKTKEGVRRGETISSILKEYSQIIFPLFIQMVVVGEKTGTLDSSLNNIVDFYQVEVERALDSFIKLLEPLFIIILGLIVAGLMAAVIMPIYTIQMM